MESAVQTRTENAAATALAKLASVFEDALAHDGFADIRVDIRLLRRGQKEVIVHFGKQYRYVVDGLPGTR